MKNKKTLIIGAGISGLAAARKLSMSGFPVTVLEAQSRTGGRALTDYSLGIPVSLGPQWFHGIENNPLVTIANKLSLKYKNTEFFNLLFFDRNEQLVSAEYVNSFFEDFDSTLAQAKSYALQQPQDISLLAALDAVDKSEGNSQIKQDLYGIAKHFLSIYTAASLKNLSGRYWDQEKILPGGNYFLVDGFTPIIDELAKSCDIHFNTKVLKICHDKSGVTVITEQEEFTAEKAIITIPLGVLKKGSILFEPDLPENKKSAIQKLQMGILNSVVLKFPKIFWPTNYSGMYFTCPELDFRCFTNLNYLQQEPIITGRVSGDQAQMLEALDDKELVEKAMFGLRKVFGHTIPEPSQYLITRWGRNPFSYGSYSYIPIGATGTECDVLAEPIGNRLFFAGEATHREYPATTHGAYLSGIREAERVINTSI